MAGQALEQGAKAPLGFPRIYFRGTLIYTAAALLLALGVYGYNVTAGLDPSWGPPPSEMPEPGVSVVSRSKPKS